MTPEEFTRRMEDIFTSEKDDTEAAHERADHLLCELLESLGYEDGVKIFKDATKWYA